MIPLNAILLLAVANPGEPSPTQKRHQAPRPQVEILEFTADWCEQCRIMEPTVERLRRDGIPIKRIDVDRRKDLVRQYGVSGIPLSVITVNGRAVGRLQGAATYGQLTSWFRQHHARAIEGTADKLTVRGQSPPPLRGGPSTDAVADRGARMPGRTSSTPDGGGSPQRAMQATVRLKVEDETGFSFGTGTIVDTHGDEALVLTCGHLFRASRGRGTITVDLTVPGSEPVRGELIAWDADRRDIAVVSIRPGVRVQPVLVAGERAKLVRGIEVFSVGCNGGQAATIQQSQIVTVDRYDGPSNIEVKGQPVDGRSGGGLFNSAGQLIGICRAADPTDNEGIYVGLPVIHSQLDQIGQSHVYKRPPALPALPRENNLLGQQPGVDSRDAQAGMGREVPGARRFDQTRPAADAAPLARPGEMICIIRDADGRSRMITIPRPSPQLVRQLMSAAGDSTAIASDRRGEELRVRGQDE